MFESDILNSPSCPCITWGSS